MTSHDRPFRIVFIGDVHGSWTETDSRFLEDGDQDLAVFLGDLGDEDVGIVQRISEIDAELLVMLGNHDAWESFTQRKPTPALNEMLELLGEDHVAFSSRELPAAGLTLIGARPFSWGGRDIRSPELYQQLYGISSHEESAARIASVAAQSAHDDILIVAHNGPLGLGDHPSDIWGRDFGRPGGDWGDRDLRLAIDRIVGEGKRVRGLAAGHMHDRLLFPRGMLRKRFVRKEGIDFINTAVVPRIQADPEWGQLHHVVSTDWRDGRLVDLEEVWFDNGGRVRRRVRPEFLLLDAFDEAHDDDAD